MAEDEQVKGMGEAMKQAEAGMKLFAAEESLEIDVPAANAFKEEMDAKIAALEEEAKALTGKDNKKARTEKEKEKKAIKDDKQYIDACKVVKGQEPKNGFFVRAPAAAEPAAPAAAAAAAEPAAGAGEDAKKGKEKKPAKAKESAGISREEKDELERLKNQIIEKKKALKEQGMSGGQMNKDEEIVAWVSRMNELKEKENPGALQAAKDEKKAPKKGKKLDSETQALLEDKKKAFEEYTERLRTEFKYSKKEIAADPDYCDMKAEIAKIESGK